MGPILRLDDGVLCTLDIFLEDNREGLSEDEVNSIVSLRIGETYSGGGGAAAEWSVTRVQLVEATNDYEVDEYLTFR